MLQNSIAVQVGLSKHCDGDNCDKWGYDSTAQPLCSTGSCSLQNIGKHASSCDGSTRPSTPDDQGLSRVALRVEGKHVVAA